MYIVKLKAVEDPLDPSGTDNDRCITFRIPKGGYSADTGRIDFTGAYYEDYTEDMLNEIYSVWSADAAFLGMIGRYPEEDPGSGTGLTGTCYKDARDRIMTYRNLIYPGDNSGWHIESWHFYIAGSDPATRRYVQFTFPQQSTTAPSFKIYTKSGDTYTQVIGSTSLKMLAYKYPSIGWYGIKDFESFKNAATMADSCNYVSRAEGTIGTCSSGHDPVTGDTVTKIPWVYRGYATTSYLDWLYYLYQGDAPDPEEESSNKDPYNKDGNGYDTSRGGGGDGNGNPYDHGDPIPEEDLPTTGLGSSGFVTLYTPSSTTLHQLASYMWDSNFFTTLVKEMYADPMDVIISLGMVPFNVTPAGSKNIVVGERDTGISSAYPASEFVKIDCGSVQIKKIIGSYLDYAPYTKLNLFLPFVGMVSLNTDIYMGKTMGVSYHINIITGEFTAYVMADSKVFNQYSGNLKMNIPISGANYAQMWNTIIAATAGLATAGTAAGAAGGAGAAGATEGASFEAAAAGDKAMQGAGKTAGDILNSAATKPEFTFTNSMSVGTGYLGVMKPYVVIERPNVCLPMDQSSYMGYPSFVTKKLSDLRGYIRVSDINLKIPGATSAERAEIERYLKSGVYMENGTTPSGSGVVLCQNNSSNNTIGKSLSSVDSLTGTFRSNVNIVNPIFTIGRDSPTGFNYVSIPDFGRCYYVEEVNVIRKGILEVKCQCDVLQSFMSQIKALSGIIDKSESTGVYNLYINDNSLKVYQDALISTYSFASGFSNSNTEYVLLVAGK